MVTYRIRVLDMMVHEWSRAAKFAPYEVGSYRTPEELREALEYHFPGIELVQEEEHAYRDDNGRYIVDYTIAVEKVQVEPYFFEEN